MADNDRGQPVEVHVGECRCPGLPGSPVHPAGDTVWLKPEVDVPMAMAANAAFFEIQREGYSQAEAIQEVQYALTGIYLRHAIESWTFVDEDGETVPIRPAHVRRLLPFANGGQAVAEQADLLYSGDILAPLVEQVRKAEEERKAQREMRKSSRDGRTGRSISATPSSGSTPPELSAPSSPASLEDGRPSEVLAR